MNQLVNRAHRDRMEQLEDIIRESDSIAPVEYSYNHYFAHGVYVRELSVVAGTVLTGAIHKNSSINMLTKGSVKVITDEGDHLLEAPATFVTGAGVKKGFLVLEDSILCNAFPWDGVMSIDEVVDNLTYVSYEAMELALGVDQ